MNRHSEDGLKNMKYRLLQKKLVMNLYTLVYVDLLEAEVKSTRKSQKEC